MSTIHSREYQFAFSLNKQASIGARVLDGAIDQLRPIRTFAPIIEEQPAVVSDQAWYGKGHSFPTFRDVLQRKYTLNSQERSATALELLYAAAFVMGNVVSVQPDSSGSPNEWEHTITWQEPSTNKEVLYTTIVEAMGAEYTKILKGAWLDEFTLTANRDDHVTVSFAGGGRDYQDHVFTMPSVASTAFFKTLYGTVLFGAADAPAAIPTEVLNWTLTLGQNPQPLWLMGNSAGAEQNIAQVLIGDQVASGNFVIKINTTHRDRFLDQDTVELQLVLGSPTTIDTNTHQCTITLHNLKISSEDFGEEGDTVSYTLNFDQESVLKTVADEHVTVKFDYSNIDNTALLVTSP